VLSVCLPQFGHFTRTDADLLTSPIALLLLVFLAPCPPCLRGGLIPAAASAI
jgi:hypothetical protein